MLELSLAQVLNGEPAGETDGVETLTTEETKKDQRVSSKETSRRDIRVERNHAWNVVRDISRVTRLHVKLTDITDQRAIEGLGLGEERDSLALLDTVINNMNVC